MNEPDPKDASGRWYARPVLAVADVATAIDFYVEALGFGRDWTHEEDGRPLVAQVGHDGCELILSSQWPERVGHGVVFIELQPAAHAALLARLAERGVATEDGWWGSPVSLVRDPSGNTLYFPREDK